MKLIQIYSVNKKLLHKKIVVTKMIHILNDWYFQFGKYLVCCYKKESEILDGFGYVPERLLEYEWSRGYDREYLDPNVPDPTEDTPSRNREYPRPPWYKHHGTSLQTNIVEGASDFDWIEGQSNPNMMGWNEWNYERKVLRIGWMKFSHGFFNEWRGIWGVGDVGGGADAWRRFALRPFALLFALATAPEASISRRTAAASSHRIPVQAKPSQGESSQVVPSQMGKRIIASGELRGDGWKPRPTS